MTAVPSRFFTGILALAGLALATAAPASAGGFYGGSFGSGGGYCHEGGGGGSTVNIIKNIDITKNIDLSKNISINKTITINKGGAEAEAEAYAFAAAMASANASASANVTVYYGNYQNVTINARGGGGGAMSAIRTEGHCEMQEASVVKAIHAVCVSADGHEFPASHMIPDTWVDTSYEGEVARCIPGAHLKITIGDVVQSDQGMAGTYASGVVLQCGAGEAVRHYKDGMLKCAAAVPVPDCTERTNLRRYGTGDMFFSYRTTICAGPARTAARAVELDGMSLDGGVGDSGY